MSFTDISRNCFQSGLSATKWLSLCKTYVQQNSAILSEEEIATQISNSVLVLYQSYPAEPGLNSYLKHAIEDGILPLPIYVATFLEASAAYILNSDIATLDFLCGLTIKLHEDSGHLSLGSLLPSIDDPSQTLLKVDRCLRLLRLAGTAHTQSARQHNLLVNSGKLLMHLLSCVNDISVLPFQEAYQLWDQTNTLLISGVEISEDLRGSLSSFLWSLNLHLSSDETTGKEAQMIQNMQMAKGDIGGPNSENDIITLGLLLQYLVTQRGQEFGAGNTAHAVALLVSTWRWSSWPAHVFYAQIFVSAFSCLASNMASPPLWRAFVIGRLPVLLAAFQRAIGNDPMVDWRASIQNGLRQAFRRPDLIVQGDHILSRAMNPMNLPDANAMVHDSTTPSYTHALLQELVRAELIDQQFAFELDPSLVNEGGSNSTPYFDTCMENGNVDLTAAESKLANEVDGLNDHGRAGWFDRLAKDVGAHAIFANWALKRFTTCSKSLDVEPLSNLCKLLYTEPFALDLVALHVKLSDLVFYSLLFLEEYDCETVGNPHTAVEHLGDVVLLVQYTLGRFQLGWDVYVKEGRTLPVDYLRQTHEVFSVESLSPQEAASFHSWFKALFDSSDEGIEDGILRSTHPKTLLRISATLFSRAIEAASMQKIEPKALYEGISFFTGRLLNWTLVGVVKALILTAQLPHAKSTAPGLDIAQRLLLSESCPHPVHMLCRAEVLRFASEARVLAPARGGNLGVAIGIAPTFDYEKVASVVRGRPRVAPAAPPVSAASAPPSSATSSGSAPPQSGGQAPPASGRPNASAQGDAGSSTAGFVHSQPFGTSPNPLQYGWTNYARENLRFALDIGQKQRIPEFDVDRCLRMMDAGTFVRHLWEETIGAAIGMGMPMGPAAMMGGNLSLSGGGEVMQWLEVCRRVAVYVLTMPMRGVWVGEPGDGPPQPQVQSQQGPNGDGATQERKRRRPAPPLLPVFMHLAIPSIIFDIDKRPVPGDQTQLIEVATTIIFSSLTAALHLEWALSNIDNLLNPDGSAQAANGNGKGGVGDATGVATARRIPPVLGASSGSVARRLAADLRARKDSHASRLILERLGSSQSFVANFPYFGSGIEG